MSPQTLAVDGLHCGGCVNTVRVALLELTGVRSVDVTLGTGVPSTVVIEADHALDLDDIQAALSDRGDFVLRR